jgi:hypothetical protein
MNYLFAFDFDGTIAKTSESGPSGMNVLTAYRQSIQEIFGDEGLVRYRKIGELGNRAPSELVHELLKQHKKSLVENAWRFYEKNKDSLLDVIPPTKGVSLDSWKTENQEMLIAELLVRQKLRYLLGQVGQEIEGANTRWPKLCTGFEEFWNGITNIGNGKGERIKTAIISSGHEAFIRKSFVTNNLTMPDYIVSDDDIRGRKYPNEISRLVKPGQFQMALVHWMWMKDLGTQDPYKEAEGLRNYMCYFGDDPNKDGVFARVARIPFGLYREESEWSSRIEMNTFTFGDWKNVSEAFLESGVLFRDTENTIRNAFLREESHINDNWQNSHHGIEK